MGITVGAALKKVAAAILTEPKVLKNILFAILVVLVALLLPMVMVVCLFSGRFQVDTAELQRHVEANLTAADVQLLRSVEDTMAEIEFAMTAWIWPSREWSVRVCGFSRGNHCVETKETEKTAWDGLLL